MSLLGRPNMDDELDNDELCQGAAAQPDDNGLGDDQGNDDDDDDDDDDDFDSDWAAATVKDGQLTFDKVSGNVAEAPTSMLFVPEPVVSLLNDAKPAMPMHTQNQLPPLSVVWVTDEADVKLLLKDHFDAAVRVVCNGRERGVVLRHTGADIALVLFENEKVGLKFAFTLPRACLSLEKIEPYESDKVADGHRIAADLGVSVGGVGNLGPRAGRGTAKVKEEVNIFNQHYETMPSNSVVSPSAEAAIALLKKGKLDQALEQIERAIADDVIGEHRKEHFCVRSTINLFMGKSTNALQDALNAIEVNPSWVKGYLRAARAYKALGKFTLASHMINQSLLLLPHSADIAAVSDMNNFLRRQQMELEAAFPVTFRLDCMYAKRLFTKRGFQPAEIILEEKDCIIAMPSMHNKSACCSVCLSSENVSAMPTSTNAESTDLFCSTACLQRSSLYLDMELDRHQLGVKSALSLIHAKAASSMNMLPLEQARLALRLFLMVCTTHERLRAQQQQQRALRKQEEEHELDENSVGSTAGDEDVSVVDALKHLGVHPTVSTTDLDAKVREELTILVNVATQRFTDPQKGIYPPSLFLQLYAFVAAYVLFVSHQPAEPGSSPVKGYYLGRLCGGLVRAEQPNCKVVASASGKISVVACSEILKDSALTVEPLKMVHAE